MFDIMMMMMIMMLAAYIYNIMMKTGNFGIRRYYIIWDFLFGLNNNKQFH